MGPILDLYYIGDTDGFWKHIGRSLSVVYKVAVSKEVDVAGKVSFYAIMLFGPCLMCFGFLPDDSVIVQGCCCCREEPQETENEGEDDCSEDSRRSGRISKVDIKIKK